MLLRRRQTWSWMGTTHFHLIVNSDYLKLVICQLKYVYIKIKLHVRLITVLVFAFIRSIIICMHKNLIKLHFKH
jgi:hypothetical protein